jgi:Reverse transcriptase (RNA-dependent DNA polymerase)
MDSLISSTQTAYIKGSYIMDNVVCAHEALHTIKKNKISAVIFKIIFEKAFDRVNWDFLLEILQGRKFGHKWIHWIQDILYSGKTCINVNETLGEYFTCKRGVRQGDPLFVWYYFWDIA